MLALGMPGMMELGVIAAICLLIFGPKQIPRFGKALGETIREMKGVKKELQGLHDDVVDE